MNQDHIQKLKKLKLIEPDPVFLKKSRVLILSAKSVNTSAFRWPVLVWTMSSVFAVLIIGFIVSISILPAKPVLSAALDTQSLNNEFTNLNISIQLQEINYDQSVGQTINSAIGEIKNNAVKHLNDAVLKNESAGLNLEESSSQINQLLDNLVSN
ncbi:MAG: hypothetical protein AAB432_01455 [Patescibacteria group bacterium]